MDRFLHKLPGIFATGILTLLTVLWVFWGVGEMYYEGWWGAWTNRLPYLVPGAAFLIFTGLGLSRPRLGGWMMIGVGVSGFAWWMARQGFESRQLLIGFMLGGFASLIGVLFLFEDRYQRRRYATGWKPSANWLVRNSNYLVGFVPALAAFIGVCVHFLPLILDRYDDHIRGSRLIEGNGVTLIWAQAGPGWSEGIGSSQKAGYLLPNANLSWDKIAFYGVPPIGYGDKPNANGKHPTASDMQLTGLCRFLSADGSALMTEPQDIWRMPTTDEIVRSLVRRGKNAGCSWDGLSDHADCRVQPNKDSPLWNPDTSPIYYWSADEHDSTSAWYVPYTGGGSYGGAIDYQPKDWGNSRHGFRCVREP